MTTDWIFGDKLNVRATTTKYGYSYIGLVMRRVSEASLFFLGFPREKKALHNGSYEHRVQKIKKTKHYCVCMCV